MRALAGLAAFLVVAAVGFVAFITLLPEGTEVDCTAVRMPTSAQWDALDPLEQNRRAVKLERCDRIDGLTVAEVEEIFGAPDDGGTDQGGRYTMLYELSNGNGADDLPRAPDKWEITFPDDAESSRVVESTIIDTM